ncbi:hypothetical protein ERD78_16610 [Allopusillimonas soli]|uniref:LPS O-antigen chain length determinant protein WzzB n=1 Tax=Allopusillimonas soli TaxID=659016 RepID=A0A853FGA5_9BURK|nr:Wzz/FepE/Etk N-terminal domain-containing protein [Allopusillimonas soli]NYT38708.1 LPS O-antigen chain length determinant protein WzzB [Allopusillimonas soli]TEA71593.1 hypothetical protein ERD78_16610 [Allopusillimonas soli]
MTSPPQHAKRPIDDELDIFLFFVLLWRKRLFIWACMLIGMALAAAYTYLVPEKWTSTARLQPPKIEQIRGYLEQRRAMARVDGNKTVDTAALTNALYSRFVALAAEARHKMDYLAGTAYYRRLLKHRGTMASPGALYHLAEDALHIKAPEAGQIAPYHELSFTADSPESAQQTLAGFIAWINDLAFRQVDTEFNDALDAQIMSRQTALRNIDLHLHAERDHRIAQLEAALHTAQAAELGDYALGRAQDGTMVIELSDARRLYMHGEKYLRAELATAKETPVIHPPHYHEMQRDLRALQPLRSYDIRTQSYDYQLAPTLPMRRDSPQRTMSIMLGALLGMLAACFWTLVMVGHARQPYTACE